MPRIQHIVKRGEGGVIAPLGVQNPKLDEKLETSKEVVGRFTNLFRGLKILL